MPTWNKRPRETYYHNKPVQLAHINMKPQRCSHPGCFSRQIFKRYSQYLRHAATHGIYDEQDMDLLIQDDPSWLDTDPSHVPYTPQTCSYPACTSVIVFRIAAEYRYHLKTIHQLSVESVIDSYIKISLAPRQRRDQFEPVHTALPLPRLQVPPRVQTVWTLPESSYGRSRSQG
jgi:hypothetical protein